MSGLLVLRPPAAYGVGDATGKTQDDEDADDAGGAVVVEQPVSTVRGVREPVVLRHLRQPVRRGGGVDAHAAREQQRDGQAGEDEPAGPHAATSERISSLRSASTRRAPYTRSGRTAITAPTARNVITPSPMPISTWTPSIAVMSLSREMSAVPPTTYRPTNSRAATGTETNAAMPASAGTSESRLGSTAWSSRKTSQPTTTVATPMSR